MRGRRVVLVLWLAAAAAGGLPLARADQPAAPPAKPAESASDDLWGRKTLLGDLGGLRPSLEAYGLSLGLTETSEILGNLTGERARNALYEGVSDLNLGLDLRRNFAWRGNFFARAYQIHGRGLTANNLLNLNTASSIEAARTTRLVELWYEQHYSDWLRVRVGQQTIATDFVSPESARLFVNGAFGWPTLAAIDLPSGGPGYPLGAPAVQLRLKPATGLTLIASVFNGDPTGAGVGGSQLRDPSGTAFRIGDGAFAIAELRYNPEDSDGQGNYHIGAWFNSERFRDQRLDSRGLSVANPASTGQPLWHPNDFSFYAGFHQPLPVGGDTAPPFAIFTRAMVAPGDRNLVSLYVDAGVAYKGLFGRADDRVGVAVGYARIGRAARALDADIVAFTGEARPVRSGEGVVELTYRCQVAPWWQVQPDLQYIFNPGGGVTDPNAPSRRLRDAVVLGLRTSITF